jgi:hypothetical protein
MPALSRSGPPTDILISHLGQSTNAQVRLKVRTLFDPGHLATVLATLDF